MYLEISLLRSETLLSEIERRIIIVIQIVASPELVFSGTSSQSWSAEDNKQPFVYIIFFASLLTISQL